VSRTKSMAAVMIAGNSSIWLVGAFWIAVILNGTLAVRLTPEGLKAQLDQQARSVRRRPGSPADPGAAAGR
jgi:hypothetical protein